MSRPPLANPAIAQMSGACALPRMSGELIFNDDWERRAFAIAVSLAEQGHFAWREFQQQLIEAISHAERREPPSDPGSDYYASWLVALEALLGRKRARLLTELAERGDGGGRSPSAGEQRPRG